MPIYSYRCTECGHERDVLQRLSDPVLGDCPNCGRDTFSKQLTAPGCVGSHSAGPGAGECPAGFQPGGHGMPCACCRG